MNQHFIGMTITWNRSADCKWLKQGQAIVGPAWSPADVNWHSSIQRRGYSFIKFAKIMPFNISWYINMILLRLFLFFSYWSCCICYFASKHSLEHSYFYSITYVYIFSSCLRALSFPSGLFLSFYTNVLSITSDKESLLKSFKNLKWILFQGQIRK